MHEIIDSIVIHAPDKSSGHRKQMVDINFRFNVLKVSAVLDRRNLDVNVGFVEYNTKDNNGKNIRKQLEVDFVVNRGFERYYIQSALSVADPEKRAQETSSLLRIPDSFRKMIVVKDYMKPWTDEHGIQYIGIEQFLLDEGSLK